MILMLPLLVATEKPKSEVLHLLENEEATSCKICGKVLGAADKATDEQQLFLHFVGEGEFAMYNPDKRHVIPVETCLQTAGRPT